MMMSELNLKIILNAPLEEVWNAWTDDSIIVKWFSPNAYIESCLGGAYELYFDPNDHNHMSTIGCKVTEYQPMNHLSFTWKGPDQYADIMNNPDNLTHVKVKLSREGEETTVSLTHECWGEGDKWVEAKEWHRKAWEGVFKELNQFFS
jgi:uncharacterized protein YndB with AHSA1/START domain